ncbi:MAG TPA: hypothetical protein VKQ54_06370, partial [Caulobacteraceae bacterium]|nr:hypothetical protein [Caulobacteraceae bacterium]
MTPASTPHAGARGAGARLCLLLLVSLLSIVPAQAAERRLRTETLDVVTHQGVRHFTVEIADTEATREHGLMFRKHLTA